MAMSDCCGSQSCVSSQQQHCALVLPCQPPKAILRACLRPACAYVHFVLRKKGMCEELVIAQSHSVMVP